MDSCNMSGCSETDSATDQQTKTSGRKKTKIDHITVEYLRDHHCFDMPLAVSALSVPMHQFRAMLAMLNLWIVPMHLVLLA